MFTKRSASKRSASKRSASKRSASDGAANDYFGNSVAVDGDTVVVGATGDDDNGSNSGAAYVFTKHATGWTAQVPAPPSPAPPTALLVADSGYP